MSEPIRPDYLDLTDDEREAVQGWVRGHGIDPRDVPLDGVRFDDATGEYVITVYKRDADGRMYLDEADEVATREERRPADPPLPWPTAEPSGGAA